MSQRFEFESWSIDRRLAYGYAAAGLVLLAAIGMRAAKLEEWFWRAVLLMFVVVSLRSALVWASRRKPSKLNWWLRPNPIAEREFTVTWLICAVVFGAATVLPLLIGSVPRLGSGLEIQLCPMKLVFQTSPQLYLVKLVFQT